MHPAFSVIFFTTASGAGYGVLILTALAILTGQLAGQFWPTLILFLLHLFLVTGGLLSSTFHLGHPERAWRAFSQWRSSWLSREGVFAVATYVPVGLLGLNWLVTGQLHSWLAVIALLLAFATVVSTAMIYVSLKAVPRWAHPLVLPNYLVLAIATGGLWFLCVMRTAELPTAGFTGLVLVAVAAGWLLKALYWRAIADLPASSTLASATGLGKLGPVRLLDPPHTEANYLQKEMGFQVARKHKEKLRRLTHLFCYALPLIALILVLITPAPIALVLLFLAALSASFGVVVERWLFFAEAKHKAMLYYGHEVTG